MRLATVHDRGARRARGLTLVEVSLAMAVFGLIAIPVSFTLVSGMKQRDESHQHYLALSGLRSFIAEVQNIANEPQDLIQQLGVGAIYDRYHGQTVTLSTPPGATVRVLCHANETNVPVELGGPQDLNYDGDAEDDLGNESNGSDLKLVPMTLTLTYPVRGENHTRVERRLLTKTTE